MKLSDENSVPIDLTGFIFTGQIRSYVSSPDIVASFSFTLADQVTNTGEVEVYLSSTISSAIDLGTQRSIERVPIKFSYDIESDNSGDKKRWLEGIAEISPEVTR
jgi:hypothetical protein